MFNTLTSFIDTLVGEKPSKKLKGKLGNKIAKGQLVGDMSYLLCTCASHEWSFTRFLPN